MGTFVLKRKLYAEEQEQKKGMGLGKKLAIGGTLVAGGLYGAKKGMFGARAMKTVNTGLMKAGSKINGGIGAKGNWLGDKMITSGAHDYGKAKAKIANQAVLNKTNSNLTKKAQQSIADRVELNQIEKYTGTGAWKKPKTN